MSFFRNWFYLYIRPNATESVFEGALCLLGEPYRAQYPFPSLRRVADFVLPRGKIVIEVDGASHDTLVQRHKDLTSTIALEKLGWAVVRFTNQEVTENACRAVESIRARVATRPTLLELEEALRQLPELPVRKSKRRAPKRAPGPKKARKGQKT